MDKNNISSKKILEIITEIYIIAIIIVFPIIVDKTGFFKILECKYYAHLYINVLYLFTTLSFVLYFKLIKKEKILFKFKLSKIQLYVVIFWMINIIACLFSPYFKKYNLFIGAGRGEGLINISLYCISFLFVTTLGKFKKRYITYFSISSLVVLSICVIQYWGFNPFNMYQDGIGTHNVSFLGTVGNIDFLSALLVIYLTMSFMEYVFFDEVRWKRIINIMNVLLGSFIIGIIDVDSGKVAFFSTIMILLPFLLVKSKRLSNTIVMVIMIVAGYCLNLFINPKYFYETGKLKFCFQITPIIITMLVVMIVLAILSKVLKKETFSYDISNNKKIYIVFYLIVVVGAVMAIAFIYCVDINIGIFHEIHEILHGHLKDEYGTYRIFLWKRSINLMRDYPLIGTGPDTFALRFMPKYYKDIQELGELTINDTAANVYLTMFVNIGVLGLIAYLLFVISILRETIKCKNEYSKLLSTVVVAFLIQDFFNLWVVITTPIYWQLLAILYLSIIENYDNIKNKI